MIAEAELPLGSPTHSKAREVAELYAALEQALAAQNNVKQVGLVYMYLQQWQRDHEWDDDLQGVLDFLASSFFDHPGWRRQALEESYRLLYDEVARSGSNSIRDLPEPPTSEEIGFRRLNEALVTGKASTMDVVTGSYEDRNGCALTKRKWEYQIRRIPPPNPGGISGRRIYVTRQMQDCPVDARALRKFGCSIPSDGCCARRDTARRARGPFLLPEGSRAAPKRPPRPITGPGAGFQPAAAAAVGGGGGSPGGGGGMSAANSPFPAPPR